MTATEVVARQKVSIHALLAECDAGKHAGRTGIDGFNPRTPCGVRLTFGNPRPTNIPFQSTHSLWSATGSLQDNIRA